MDDCNRCMVCVGGICRAQECYGSISGFFDGDGDIAEMAAGAYREVCDALGLIGGQKLVRLEGRLNDAETKTNQS